MDEAENEVDKWRRRRGHKREREKEAMLLISPHSVDGHPLLFSDLDETDTDMEMENTPTPSAHAVAASRPRHSALFRTEATSKWDPPDHLQIKEQTDEMQKHMQHMKEMRQQEMQRDQEELQQIQKELKSLKQLHKSSNQDQDQGHWISE